MDASKKKHLCRLSGDEDGILWLRLRKCRAFLAINRHHRITGGGWRGGVVHLIDAFKGKFWTIKKVLWVLLSELLFIVDKRSFVSLTTFSVSRVEPLAHGTFQSQFYINSERWHILWLWKLAILHVLIKLITIFTRLAARLIYELSTQLHEHARLNFGLVFVFTWLPLSFSFPKMNGCAVSVCLYLKTRQCWQRHRRPRACRSSINSVPRLSYSNHFTARIENGHRSSVIV